MRLSLRRVRRRHIVAVMALVAAFAVVIARGLRHSRWRGFAPSRGTVRRVIDGDTFDLTNAARIRLLDIDTPEFGGSESERVLAQRATDALKGLIGDGFKGREVTLTYGLRVRDRYGRFLAYCFVEPEDELEEGAEAEPVFVNLELVRQGLARVYAGRGHGPRFEEIVAAERGAREAKRGVWAEIAAF